MPRRQKTHYGEGSVYESPQGSGRWFAEVFDGHGKSIRRRANSRDEAEAKRQELIRRRDGGLNVQGAAQTLETFVNVWREQLPKGKGPVTEPQALAHTMHRSLVLRSYRVA
jgi:hypothetical protein